ncbi:MAG: hypothetical protein HWN69_04325 [Desulfobacterales bacterium]|nr:hypothetical protein [Desulfobacterales bacterium]
MKIIKSFSVENRGPDINPRISFLATSIVLLGITVAMFSDVLFSSKAIVLSKSNADLFDQFAYWREFGFGHLRQGVLALWNPHIFSGMPFFGGFQSALLYPLNILYLILPLSKAINFSIALHVFLTGIFMYLWTSHRGLHPLACLVSSVLLMFCGAHFMQIQAGHLPHLCTMTWAPLMFLSIDGFFEKRSLGWCLLGMFVITMQILAGYPQHVFYTAVAATIYSAFCMIKVEKRAKIALGLLGMYAGASALGAVQLLTGIRVAWESIRSTGLSYEFASRFSFPPENLVTFLAPGFLGDGTTLPYWGCWYLWEMSLFVSVTGFILAIYGSIHGERSTRRFSMTMALLLLLFALGGYTPLFKILHTWVPGFDMFRGNSKFIFYASLFITMLAGIGLDHILRHKHIHRRTIFTILVFGLLVGAAGVCIRYSVTSTNSIGWWSQVMRAVCVEGESYFLEKYYAAPYFVQKAGLFASKSLMVSAGTCLLLSLLFFLSRFSRKMVYVIALLAMAEIFIFGKASIATLDLASIRNPKIERMLAGYSGNYRIFNPVDPNTAMSMGANDIWGYDSVVLRRYAEFMTFTQGYSPDEATQYVKFSRFHRLYKMLRCRFAFIPSGSRIGIIENKKIMPRLQLMQNYLVIQDRDRIFDIMEDASFDPAKKVILETYPDHEPVVSDEKGTASVVDSSVNHLTIEAELPNPAILLITDTYSSGWRAMPLPGSSQKEYNIMPANYVLRAIPLSRGYHLIRIEYLPSAFRIGKWISISTVFVYIILLGWHFRRAHGMTAVSLL